MQVSKKTGYKQIPHPLFIAFLQLKQGTCLIWLNRIAIVSSNIIILTYCTNKLILEIIFPDKFLFQGVVVAITTNGNAEIRNLNVKLFRKSTATLIIIFPSFVAYKLMAMLFLLYRVTYMYYSFVIYQCQCLVIILYIIGGIIMTKDFIVRPKYTDKKEDKSITMTIRLERELQEEYDKLSAKSGRSRNELMCMALRYALENLKFVE